MKHMQNNFQVLVFKTSVETQESVKALRSILDTEAGRRKWNFALDDRDRILRITSQRIDARQTISLLNDKGFECYELED